MAQHVKQDAVEHVRLKPETLAAFDAYIREAEAPMERTLAGEGFLWARADPKRERQLRKGKILTELWSGKATLSIPAGIIHDWIGAAFVSPASIDATLALIQDYDNHKCVYQPSVIDSKLIRRKGDDFKIFLRVLKKKIITVVLDTDHDVHYFRPGPDRAGCRSYTTRTAEVDDAGSTREKIHPPDTGYGFLWRLNTYWRFEQCDGGVYMECRAISLTRDIPAVLRLIIEPIVRSLPKEALIHTLESTRRALLAGPASAR